MLSFMQQYVPWSVQLMAWILGLAVVLVVWLPVSVLAYPIEEILRRVKERLTAIVERQDHAFEAARDASSRQLRMAFDTFFDSHNYKDIRNRNPQEWRKMCKRVTEPMASVSENLSSATGAIKKLSEKISKATDQLPDTDAQFPPIPEQPPLKADDSRESLQRLNKARASLAVAGFLIVALVFVNIGMLSQILRDILPAAQIRVIGSIRLSHGLAFFLTTIEAGIGALHAQVGEEKEDGTASFFPQALTILGAIGFAFIEGFFYSRVGSANEVIRVLGITLTLEFVFFLLGFLLPLILSALGVVAYRSLMIVVEGHTVKHYRSLVKRFDKDAKRLEGRVKQIKTEIGAAKKQGDEFVEKLPQLSEKRMETLVNDINRQTREIRDLSENLPDWAVDSVRELKDSEVHQHALFVGALLFISLGTIGLSIWMEIYLLKSIGPALEPWVVATIAIARGLILLGSGLVLRPRPVALEEAGAFRPVNGVGLGRWLAVAVTVMAVVTVLGFETYVLFQSAAPVGLGLPWAVVVGTGLVLVALGRWLPSMVGMAICCAFALVALLQRAGRWLGIWLLKLLIVVMWVVEFIAWLLASPLRWILRFFDTDKQQTLPAEPETANGITK